MVGTIIIAVSYLLRPLQSFLDLRKKTAGYACIEWTTTESLQLQRAAYQGISSGTWTGHFDAIPVTKADELLGDLPRTYDTGPESSCIVEAKLGAEELKSATTPCRPADRTSNGPNAPVEEEIRYCTSGVEQASPTGLRDNTPQAVESCTSEDAGMSSDARVPSLAAISLSGGKIEWPYFNQIRADISSRSEPATERLLASRPSLERL